MERHQEIKKWEIEITKTENPITLNVPGSRRLVGLEIEQFFYRPPVPTSAPAMIGIAVEGTRGRFDETGRSTEIVKTIPQYNNVYIYDTFGGEKDAITFQNIGSSFKIMMIDRSVTSLNPTKVTFVNNYLLVCNLYYVDNG